MTELAVREDTSPVISQIEATVTDMRAAAQIAELMCKTSFVPKEFRGKPEEATVAILYGQTVGMDPVTSLQQVYVIGGKPALYARAMVSIVLNAGHEVWTEEASSTKVVVCGRRAGSERVERSEWTVERAKTAGYTSNALYQKDPEAMLYARASGTVTRRVAPDALLGMAHSAEELQIAEEDGGTHRITTAKASRTDRPRTILEAAAAIDASPAATGKPDTDQVSVDADNLLSAIEATDNADALREIWRTASALPEDQREEVRRLVTERIEDLAALRDATATATKEN